MLLIIGLSTLGISAALFISPLTATKLAFIAVGRHTQEYWSFRFPMSPIGVSVTGNFSNTSKGNVTLNIKDSEGSTVYSSPEENSGFFAFRATDSGDYKFYVDNLENDLTTVVITVKTATSDGVALAALVMGLSCIAIGYFARRQLRKPKNCY